MKVNRFRPMHPFPLQNRQESLRMHGALWNMLYDDMENS